MVAVEQVRVGSKTGEMSFGPFQRDARIGGDLVEMRHQVPFGHRRQILERCLGEPIGIDSGQQTPVPGGVGLGVANDLLAGASCAALPPDAQRASPTAPAAQGCARACPAR